MKTVLIVGADFVPSSLPPATRIRFFASHLEEHGWRPLVLATKPEFYEGKVDPENESLLPPDIEVIRVPAFSARLTRRLGIGDVGMRSLWHQWRALTKICRARSIDAILIPVPPSITMVLGRLAYQRFRIPYIIDYIDPWVTDSYNHLPKEQRPPKWFLANLLSRTVEPFALKHVSQITGVSKGTTDSVLYRYRSLSDVKATEVPYGAEPADFEYLRSHPRNQSIFARGDGHFHISYVGACVPGMFDTIRALFLAMRGGLDTEPQLFNRIRFHFVGTNYASGPSETRDVLKLAEECGVSAYVDERRARVPYLESLQIMLDSDGLLLIGSNEGHYTASKVFPCILARKPILAIFNEASSVIEILRSTSAGECVAFSESHPPISMVTQIHESLKRIVSGSTREKETDWKIFDQYSTSAMSARLAGCLNEVADRSYARKSQFTAESLLNSD